jgi:hypothetical protein
LKPRPAACLSSTSAAPPTVATDLHRERDDPDDNKKEKNAKARSVEEFMDEVAGKLEAGEETMSAGVGNGIIERWYGTFGEQYDEAAK